MPDPDDDIEAQVNADIGGVQGQEADAAKVKQGDRPVAQETPPGTVADEPAPDSGEIEWAGGLVHKPPTPQG